jgi:hypothetical protein
VEGAELLGSFHPVVGENEQAGARFMSRSDRLSPCADVDWVGLVHLWKYKNYEGLDRAMEHFRKDEARADRLPFQA